MPLGRLAAGNEQKHRRRVYESLDREVDTLASELVADEEGDPRLFVQGERFARGMTLGRCGRPELVGIDSVGDHDDRGVMRPYARDSAMTSSCDTRRRRDGCGCDSGSDRERR